MHSGTTQSSGMTAMSWVIRLVVASSIAVAQAGRAIHNPSELSDGRLRLEAAFFGAGAVGWWRSCRIKLLADKPQATKKPRYPADHNQLWDDTRKKRSKRNGYVTSPRSEPRLESA